MLPQPRIFLPVGKILRDAMGYSYVVEAVLEKAAISATYLVRNRRLPEQLLVLKEVIEPDVQERTRLHAEGRALMKLRHPCLPRVYSVFDHPALKRVYLLLDYIPGKDVDKLREERPERVLPFDMTLSMLAPIIDALAYLHQQHPPVIHRDIRPANLILSAPGNLTVLVNYGWDKVCRDRSFSTYAERNLSPYSAPEVEGGTVSLPSDVYSLAATCYTLLAGRMPPNAPIRLADVKAHLTDPLDDALLQCAYLPAYALAALRRAMALEVQQRFATVWEFWQAIAAFS